MTADNFICGGFFLGMYRFGGSYGTWTQTIPFRRSNLRYAREYVTRFYIRCLITTTCYGLKKFPFFKRFSVLMQSSIYRT